MEHRDEFSLHPFLKKPRTSCFCTSCAVLRKVLILVNCHLTAKAHSSHLFFPGPTRVPVPDSMSGPVCTCLCNELAGRSLLTGTPSVLRGQTSWMPLSGPPWCSARSQILSEHLHKSVPPCSASPPPAKPGAQGRLPRTGTLEEGNAYTRSHTVMTPDQSSPNIKKPPLEIWDQTPTPCPPSKPALSSANNPLPA